MVVPCEPTSRKTKLDSIYAFVITPAGLHFHEIHLNTETDEYLIKFLKNSFELHQQALTPFFPNATHTQNCQRDGRKIKLQRTNVFDHGDTVLRQLYQSLWEPLEKWLPESPLVAIVPHEGLALIPFAAMLDANGKRLIEKHAITIAPSISLLSHLYSKKPEEPSSILRNTNTSLVVGNPTMPRVDEIGKLSSLPQAEEEALIVARMLNTIAICGRSACKSTVLNKITKAVIIHFATHGLVDIDVGNTKSYIL